MSNNDRLKGTTNNLIKRYSNTSWANILSQSFFESLEFQKVLATLMEQHSVGIQFTPAFPKLFRSFELCSLEGAKVIFINPHPSDKDKYNNGIALSCDNEPQDHPLPIRNFQYVLSEARTPETDEHSLDLSYLVKQGVLLLNFAMTCSVDNGKSHAELWKPAFQKLIADIAYKTSGTIFVFIGDETQYLQKAVRKGQYKFFIPSLDTLDAENDDVLNKINSILEKQKKHRINW